MAMDLNGGGPIVDWAAERLAQHGGAILTGAIGGLIGALRLRERRWWAVLQWTLVGGMVAPSINVAAVELGVSPGLSGTIVLLSGAFSFRLLDIIAQLIDRAGTLARERMEKSA